jgi:hypothetical protein
MSLWLLLHVLRFCYTQPVCCDLREAAPIKVKKNVSYVIVFIANSGQWLEPWLHGKIFCWLETMSSPAWSTGTLRERQHVRLGSSLLLMIYFSVF